MWSRSDHRRPLIVLCIGILVEQRSRHPLSNQREDLDNSISHFAESILLLPLSWLQHGPLILTALCFLARALIIRSRLSKQPEDVIHATKYLIHIRDQPQSLEIFSITRHDVATLLVDALALQIELGAGNLTQNILEMTTIFRELITLDTSDVDTTCLIQHVHGVLISQISEDEPLLDQLIECLRAGRTYRPDLLKGLLALALSLMTRYHMTFVSDDYEEATSVLDEIIASGDSQDTLVATAQGLVAGLASSRSSMYETPEHLEEEIYRTRGFFGSSSAKAIFPLVPFNPEESAKKRIRYFGSVEGVEASAGNSPLQLSLLPLASFTGKNGDDSLGEFCRTVDKMESLLFGIYNSDDTLNDTTRIDEAIEEGRSILDSYPPSLASSKACVFDLFSIILFEAFKRTFKIDYLDESISVCRQAIQDRSAQSQSSLFLQLSEFLYARFHYFPGHSTQDLDEALELLSQYVSDERGNFPHRLRYACVWALTARHNRHSSVSAAYKIAVSLIQDTILFTPTLQLQHSTLAVNHDTHNMSLDYASYQVELRQLEQAIETLERGRALLWSEMRNLRTSIDQLLEADPDLGHKFAAVNRDLEELTKSVPPSHKLSMDDGTTDRLRAVDPFGRLLLKQRDLLKERAKLISQIQALPGFDSFSTFSSFDTIRSAASSGPVIIINHSRWRSDILVLLHDMPPLLIPTPSDFYIRASALRKILLESRLKYGLYSQDYDENLAFVLAELYNLVGKPVIDRLRQLQVPEQSRIWWCPTSVFCSLPLHAMGPIPGSSDDSEPHYFLDLYICSYTPTLSALIQSRHHNKVSRSSDRPSILLVAQPDSSIPTVRGEIQVIQALDADVTSLISEAATPATVIDGFRHHGFVHFACHGALEPGKPFEGGFELYGDVRLTLLEIVRAHLPAAEFAFLSACHTAEVTEGSIMDEGLHLAAAVQYCGFRSVVGTMWAMADIDGRDLAKHFYKALFSDSREIPYHEKSAKALRFAVKKLRRKRGVTVERWVNFVHYGA